MATLLSACTPAENSEETNPTLTKEQLPLIIAHRGASGELPEHTRAAYERAIEHGADFIEPDLVMTKDGVLIVRHDRYLSTTTNVSDKPEFADRKRMSQQPSGAPKNDWWAEDFTLAEIKTLRARQPRDGRSKEFDDLYEIMTFTEVVALAAEHSIGIYPETKSPSHHAKIGLDMKAPLLDGLADFEPPVFIQSFEADILRELNELTDHKLVLLYSGHLGASLFLKSPTLENAATFADGVGPYKKAMPPNPADFIARAHKLGLTVHPYTFRADDLPDGMTFEEELNLYFDAGVDGVFADHPGEARAIRDSALKAAN